MISRPGIPEAVLIAHHIRHVTEVEALPLVGHSHSGILIPYFDLDGNHAVVNGRWFHRLRLDKPTSDAKYLSPAKLGCQLYVPHGLDLNGEICICESEFKSLALSCVTRCAVESAASVHRCRNKNSCRRSSILSAATRRKPSISSAIMTHA